MLEAALAVQNHPRQNTQNISHIVVPIYGHDEIEHPREPTPARQQSMTQHGPRTPEMFPRNTRMSRPATGIDVRTHFLFDEDPLICRWREVFPPPMSKTAAGTMVGIPPRNCLVWRRDVLKALPRSPRPSHWRTHEKRNAHQRSAAGRNPDCCC